MFHLMRKRVYIFPNPNFAYFTYISNNANYKSNKAI